MNYPIPPTPPPLERKPLTEELIADAIADVIQHARSTGRSLEEITAEVLQDDCLLDARQRHCLSEVVTQAWETLN